MRSQRFTFSLQAMFVLTALVAVVLAILRV